MDRISGGIPLIICDPSLNISKVMKKNPMGMKNSRFYISNNNLHNQSVNVIPEELKPFFRSGTTDCTFVKMTPRPVPEKITKGAK